MIRLDVEQGSNAWLQAKVGIVSASNFHRIISPVKMKYSDSADSYAFELIAETLLGRPLDDATTEFMQRGNLLEQQARDWYAFQTGHEVERVGFLMRDDGRVGCSPDGLIGATGGLEIKCPDAKGHVAYMAGETPDKYRPQIQGGLWITERETWDFVSFNPDLSPVLLTFQRDEAFITALAGAVQRFLDRREELLASMAKRGYIDVPDAPRLKLA